jgi:hypothetical protein
MRRALERFDGDEKLSGNSKPLVLSQMPAEGGQADYFFGPQASESVKLWVAAPHLRMCDRQAVGLHKGTFVKAAGCFSSYSCL